MPCSLRPEVSSVVRQTDTDKLDEYFQGIRDIETRLEKDELWLDIPRPKLLCRNLNRD